MNKKEMEEKYYITGHYENCIDNFDFFKECFFRFIEGDKKQFKWIILSVHMFLQDLFILALRNGDPFYTLENQTTANIEEIRYTFKIYFPLNNELYKIDGPNILLNHMFNTEKNLELVEKSLVKEGIEITYKQLLGISKRIFKLIRFEELFKKVKSERYMTPYINSHYLLDKSGEFTKSINKLIEIRNEFMHIAVDGWSIDYGVFYEIVPNCIRIAIFLIEESNNINSHETELKEDILPVLKHMIQSIETN